MILYTVTVEVETDAAAEWLAWMRASHVPEVLATGCFSACRIAQQTEPAPPPGYTTFVLDYSSESTEALQRYRAHFAPALQRAHTERYGPRTRASRSLRTVIE